MEDHNHGRPYRIDLRQFMSGRPAVPSSHFSSLISHQGPILPSELFPCQSSNLPSAVAPPQTHQQHNYDLMMLMPRSGLHLHDFHGDTTAPGVAITGNNNISCAATTDAVHSINSTTPMAAAAATSSSCLPNALIGSSGMVEVEASRFTAFGGGIASGDGGGTGRWPRQETLTLLEIRSSLDSKFKEANQKGPLWEEVSRIMAEEHGYQRSGKKCREKFENLYKYYKKTKEGKAGRHDGKHYRFFRQLEALYGEASNVTANQEPHFGGFHHSGNTSQGNNFSSEAFLCQKPSRESLSLSDSLGCDTSSEEDDLSTGTLGENDSTEKLRRKKRSSKPWKLKIKEFLDGQMRKLMDRQEAWLTRLTSTLEEKEKERLKKEEEWRKKEAERVDREHKFWAKEREWIEARDAALMEALHNLTGREVNIAGQEGMLGDRDHNVNIQAMDEQGAFKESNKKRKENSRNSGYFLSYESVYHPGGGGSGYCDINGQCDNGPSPGNSNAGTTVSDSCFRFLMGGNDGEHVWDTYGSKVGKADQRSQINVEKQNH